VYDAAVYHLRVCNMVLGLEMGRDMSMCIVVSL
jgi:hypothetical protein